MDGLMCLNRKHSVVKTRRKKHLSWKHKLCVCTWSRKAKCLFVLRRGTARRAALISYVVDEALNFNNSVMRIPFPLYEARMLY